MNECSRDAWFDNIEPHALRTFERLFGGSPECAVRAPGRVNIIGDHTDYHDGFVLPMAIDRAVLLLARRRSDALVRVYSEALGRSYTVDLHVCSRHPDRDAQYLQGVATVLGARGDIPNGCDVFLSGDLPPNSGLSSSSALVVGFTALLGALCDMHLDSLDLARVGRDAEHWYGTTGGIMDQFVISHGRAGSALLLDCRSLRALHVAIPPEAAIVIANTNTQHNQIASPFAQRRLEATQALDLLRTREPEIASLRDVTMQMMQQHADLFTTHPDGELLKRRARHVVTENARVLASASAVGLGDLRTVGALMSASHRSLRDDYEVSSHELDVMVEVAEGIEGCFGARLTGGGFGGSTVNLVRGDVVAEFCSQLRERYVDATDIEPHIFKTQASGGVCVYRDPE